MSGLEEVNNNESWDDVIEKSHDKGLEDKSLAQEILDDILANLDRCTLNERVAVSPLGSWQ